MVLRSGHGNGAGSPRIEVLPVDELPPGVQAPPLASAGDERRPDGTFAPGARTAQSAGGRATRGMARSPLAPSHSVRAIRAKPGKAGDTIRTALRSGVQRVRS
jgi:hypothetical protein